MDAMRQSRKFAFSSFFSVLWNLLLLIPHSYAVYLANPVGATKQCTSPCQHKLSKFLSAMSVTDIESGHVACMLCTNKQAKIEMADFAISAANIYAILPDSGWKKASVWLMYIHNMTAFTIHFNPFLYM